MKKFKKNLKEFQNKWKIKFNKFKKSINIEDIYFFLGVFFMLIFIIVKFGIIYSLLILSAICFLKTYLLMRGGATYEDRVKRR